ncbi:MAG: hypothetical protein JSV25_14750 [Spirochaetota bacterium]|nr:MAG: hypothetical protein JSV25_14750 [Spirochaetota bacterium]
MPEDLRKRRSTYITPFITLLALFSLYNNICLSDDITSETPLYHFANGRLFSVDTHSLSIKQLLRFHSTAPDVDQSPDLLFWGRISYDRFGSLDPSTGKQVSDVALPTQSYYQVITPSGKAYITHNVLTNRGFFLSVVDTVENKFLKQINGIMGLHTSFTHDEDSIYLAALGVRRPDYLYLYKIETSTDRIKEIYKVEKTDYRWEIAVYKEQLYISYICGKNRSAPPMIEVMDLKTKKINARIGSERLGKIEKILDTVTFLQGMGLFPCILDDGQYAIAFLDPQNIKIEDFLTVTGTIDRIIGIKGGILVYSGKSPDQGGKETILHFYNLKERKEVKAINMNQFYKNQ